MPTSSSTAAAAAGQGSTKAPAPAEAHDWDALFAGLDSAATPTAASAAAHPPLSGGGAGAAAGNNAEGRPPAPGRALTEEGEHDDPILKNLTGMGYSRKEALAALEKYDYNLERVSTTAAADIRAAAARVGGAGEGLGKGKGGGAGVRVRGVGRA